MTNQSCGYHTFCGTGVRFISRYRNENDYCVAGVRISVHDDGLVHSTCHVPTVAELDAIKAYEVAKHAEYLAWHAEQKWPADYHPAPSEFNFPVLRLA